MIGKVTEYIDDDNASDGDFDIRCLLDNGVQTTNRNRNGKSNEQSATQAQSSNQLRKIIPCIAPIMTTFIPPKKPNSVNRNIKNNIDSVCSNSHHVQE